MKPRANLRRALAQLGLLPAGPLRWVSEQVMTDRSSIVIKWLWNPESYLTDLDAFAAAGVRSERALYPEPITVRGFEQRGIVLAYESSCGNPPTDSAGEIGGLLRTIHDRVWPFPRPRGPGEVYCPDDWRPNNVIVTVDGPVMVDLDLARGDDRFRQISVAVHDFAGADERIKAKLLAGYNHDGRFTNDPRWQRIAAGQPVVTIRER